MKKIGLLLLFMASLADAQELDSLVTDSVEVLPPAYYLGVYFDAAVGTEPSVPSRNFFRSYSVGVQYNRWFVEAGITDQLGSYESVVIFPNIFTFRYRYGGVSFAYSFVESNLLSMRGGAGYFTGDMLWRYKDSGADFVRDTFRLFRCFVILEYAKIRYIKPFLSLGYQHMADVQVTAVERSDFSGWNAKVGVRLGFFNQ